MHRTEKPYTIIFMFGIVPLFGDIIYEGARSVTGPYLYLLGASAVVVGLLSGLGEFLGYYTISIALLMAIQAGLQVAALLVLLAARKSILKPAA